MATSLASLFVEIGLKTGAVDTGLKSLADRVKDSQNRFNGLTQASEALAVPMAGVAAGAAAVGVAIALTAGETVKYAESVRQLSRELAVGTEEASTLIQVADDLGISNDALTKSFTIALQNGIRPNIDGLKDVASGYQAIKDPIAQAEFAQKKFGRGWAEMIPLLRLTGQEFDDMAASMKGSALIMSEDAVKAARDYEIAMDGLQDQVKSLQIAIGNELIPVLTEAANTLGLLLNWDNQVQGALEQHNAEVMRTADGYDAYITEMRRAAQAVGYQINAEGDLVQVRHSNAGSIETLIQSNFAYTQSTFSSAQMTSTWGDEMAEAKGIAQELGGVVSENNIIQSDSNLVYDEAIAKLRDHNIGEAQRLELEQRLKLLSGEITQADIERADAIGFLTQQYALGKITQEEYAKGIETLAIGAAGARDIIADIGAKINALPEFKRVNIQVSINESFGGAAGEIGLGGDAPVVIKPDDGARPTGGGFQHGGSFTVPGSGSADQLFGIGLTPGETVSVTPRGGSSGGGNQPIVIQLVADGRILLDTVLDAARLRGVTMVPVN